METHTETSVENHDEIMAAARQQRWLSPVFILGLIIALGALLLAGLVPRFAQRSHLEERAAGLDRTYTVATAQLGEPNAEFRLPSSVEAAQETPLYPRVNGYVKAIRHDIGAKVQAGEVLAEIETPELDQQVAQGRAALSQAQANSDLARVSFQRWKELQQSRVVSPQEVDERKSALDARAADLVAAQANLERLEKMQRYQLITAPFAGTVTRRLVEVGQLVTGDLNDATRILFHVQQTSALRAFVQVPQSAFRSVSVGQTVEISFREFPGRTFPGEVVRTAGALDAATRTLRTEIRIPNEQGELLPGLYAEVKFLLHRAAPPVAVPSKALILQTAGPQIAQVDGAGKVTLASVSIGRDLGKTLEIASGLQPGARYITNPSDTLHDGLTVPTEEEQPAEAGK